MRQSTESRRSTLLYCHLRFFKPKVTVPPFYLLSLIIFYFRFYECSAEGRYNRNQEFNKFGASDFVIHCSGDKIYIACSRKSAAYYTTITLGFLPLLLDFDLNTACRSTLKHKCCIFTKGFVGKFTFMVLCLKNLFLRICNFRGSKQPVSPRFCLAGSDVRHFES